MLAQMRVWILALLMVWALSHASVFGESGEPVVKEPTPAEKIRKVLDQPLTLDFTGSLLEAVQHLKEKSRINFVLDLTALQQVGIGMEDNTMPPTVHLKGDRNGKLRTSLQRTLNGYNLSYVILEDSVLITTDELGLQRQLRQRVSVNVTDSPLSGALKELARTTGINLLVDPRLGKEVDVKVTLELDNAMVETAVRLLAEISNLKAVRVGNVLFVTNESRADKLRREEAPPGGTP